MKDNYGLDELTLNAYVDGQLDPEQERQVLNAMDTDRSIREQVCQLRRTKDWMRTGYGEAQPSEQPLPAGKRHLSRVQAGLAASLMALAVGLGGGILGYACAERESSAQMAALGGGLGQENPHKVLLHLGDSDPRHFQAVLDYTESFLEEHKERDVQVEVIANSGGIELMRSGESPFEDRVRSLSDKYDNLQFIACMNALRNMRKQGVEPAMIDDVHTGVTAVDHIVKRLQEGWTYRKVDNLSDI